MTGLVTLLLEKKMAAIKYIWIRLLLNGRKRQLSEDFVLLQRPLTSKYLLLDRSDSVTPVLAAMAAFCVAKCNKDTKRPAEI